jgi:molecular chaperone DnaK (HSP70)
LSGLSEAKRGTHSIEVRFNIDSDSIITVSAKLKNETTIESEIKITKDKTRTVINKDLEDILNDAENNKLYDSEIANKILNKIELYESFKFLLSVFHEKREIILKGMQENENFLFIELNKLFNKTFQIINDYENYSPKFLKEHKEQFEAEWHALLFDSGPVFKTEDGLIMEIGGSII